MLGRVHVGQLCSGGLHLSHCRASLAVGCAPCPNHENIDALNLCRISARYGAKVLSMCAHWFPERAPARTNYEGRPICDSAFDPAIIGMI